MSKIPAGFRTFNVNYLHQGIIIATAQFHKAHISKQCTGMFPFEIFRNVFPTPPFRSGNGQEGMDVDCAKCADGTCRSADSCCCIWFRHLLLDLQQCRECPPPAQSTTFLASRIRIRPHFERARLKN